MREQRPLDRSLWNAILDHMPLTGAAWGATGPRVRCPAAELKFLLFGDLVNFGALPEEHYPAFFHVFQVWVLRHVVNALKHRPAFGNTWGDGFHFVFDDAVTCADFALRTIDRMAAVDWTTLGLPPETNLRIGIHAGAVCRWRDPILGRSCYCGRPVTLAARIEPIATPGCAFTSEPFAAHLGATPKHPFFCRSLGPMRLDKEAGVCCLYLLGRK